MQIWAIVWWFGCSGNSPELTDEGSAPGTPCEPALTVVPEVAVVAPEDRVQLSGRGGTRRYQYSLVEPSYGQINPSTGVYIAPPDRDVVDVVEVRDERCDDVAVAEISVGDGFVVLPSAATVLPSTAFTLEVSGGTGDVVCAITTTASGATLDETTCAYQAGKTEGVDRLEVRDRALDVTVPVTITVSNDARLDVWGSDLWAIPEGATFAPQVSGGSQVFDMVVTAGSARFTEEGLASDSVGSGTVAITDRFAGFSQTIQYQMIPPSVPPSEWFGKRTPTGVVLDAGDLDGDGNEDVVVAFPEVNGTGLSSGAVMVYAGTGSGMESVPAFVAFGEERASLLGTAAAIGDLDGDGALDLVAGEPGSGVVGPEQGRVRVWSGLEGGWFSSGDEVWNGEAPGDRAGATVAVCDFDDDGWLDLAVGAPGHEDRANGPVVDGTGAVMVYRGDATGLATSPTVIRFGQRVDLASSVFQPMPDTRLGIRGMAVGDLDDDGHCDIAVASDRQLYGDPDPYGFVAVYRGIDTVDGVISELPDRVYANLTDPNALFGRAIAIGDVDDDGADDLLVSAPRWDGGAPDAGAVFAFLSSTVDTRAAADPYTTDDADWALVGDATGNQLGTSLSLRDLVRDDGVADLVVGEPQGELPGGSANVGRVRIFEGTGLAKGEPAFFDADGGAAGEWFGQAAAVVGDVDGDTELDVVVLAGRSDDDGLDVGSVLLARGSGQIDALEMPGQPAGHEHGTSVVVFDVDGDGAGEAVLGSPGDGDLGIGILTGSVHTAGVVPRPLAEGGPNRDAFDAQGTAMSASGDFDGDGWLDLAVVSSGDDRPATFGAAYVNPDECPGFVPGAGSVSVYRGAEDGLSATPSFVAYGPIAAGAITSVATGFDFNGDGFDDLAFGSPEWFGRGGFALVAGREAEAPQVVVLCSAQVWDGLSAGDLLGTSMTGLRDLDGDGCDELVVASAAEDAGTGNQGVVRVLWGFGDDCPDSVREVTTLGSGVAANNAGDSLASGGDVDGDGIGDLVVGGTGARVGGTQLGNVWFVPGAHLLGLERTALPLPELPGRAGTVLEPLVPDSGRFGLLGPTQSGGFGASVALVPDPADVTRAAVAVGIPRGSEGGVEFGGGVVLYRYDPVAPGLDPVPFGVVGGETHLPGGQLGASLAAGTLQDGPALVVGAPRSSQQGLELGGAYVVRLVP